MKKLLLLGNRNVGMLDEGDVVINVVGASNLERSLPLILRLLERRTPMVVALNMWHDALHRGISIGVPRLDAHGGAREFPPSRSAAKALRS